MATDFNHAADKLIAGRRFEKARQLLERSVEAMPPGWTPQFSVGGRAHVACWDDDEFQSWVSLFDEDAVWVRPSWSKAWYQLGTIAAELKEYERALFCLDAGLGLEPDHPELWSEKGYILGMMQRHQQALDCYVKAEEVRDWITPSQIGRALRGQAVQWIDLADLDAAEELLRRSLEYDPHSKVAANELRYIEEMRKREDEDSARVPWFLHSFLNPPQDPLTVRLIALVEDLPTIEGQDTVGETVWPLIQKAFIEGGWDAFEVEFDRCVPRSRQDYVDKKRDLLRDPLFSVKAHRNVARIAAGESVNNVLGEPRHLFDPKKVH